MAKARRKQTAESGSFAPDKGGVLDEDNIRNEDKVKDMSAKERRDFMRRRREEEKDAKERAKVVDYHYELNGHKLIRKTKKKNGAVYSFYVGNTRRYPKLLENEDVKKNLKK